MTHNNKHINKEKASRKRGLITSLFSLFFSLFSILTYAQQPSVQASLDTTYIRIGEQFNYTIKVANAKDVQFPRTLENIAHIEHLESKIDTLKSYLLKKYVLTSFDSGSFKIPKQQVIINSKKYFTDSLLIHVAMVKVDTLKQGMFPIKAIQKEPITWIDYLKYMVWVIPLLLLLILGIAYYFSRSKYKRKQAEKRLTPYETAVNNLETLDNKQLWQNNKVKEYYIELTDILRTYIEEDLHIPALESTTDELLETLSDFRKIKKIKVPSNVVKKIAKLLRQADLVKFAKHRPIHEEIEGHRTSTKDIIEKLKPKVTDHDKQ